jgi:hypothetical protein
MIKIEDGEATCLTEERAMVNPGFSAGIAQRSSAERIAWALSGAPRRKKDLRLSPLAAIAEGRKLRDRITEIMGRGGLRPEDAYVCCVFAKNDLSRLSNAPPEFISVKEGVMELESVKRHTEETPIGLLIFIFDRLEKEVRGHARPLLLDERSLQLNEQALAICMGILQKGDERAKAKRAAQK